jgi:hypothetical protein
MPYRTPQCNFHRYLVRGDCRRHFPRAQCWLNTQHHAWRSGASWSDCVVQSRLWVATELTTRLPLFRGKAAPGIHIGRKTVCLAWVHPRCLATPRTKSRCCLWQSGHGLLTNFHDGMVCALSSVGGSDVSSGRAAQSRHHQISGSSRFRPQLVPQQRGQR